MEYGAIDIHKKESQIRIVTESGEIVDRRIATNRERLTGIFWGRPRMRILLEAATESEWVAQHLETLGHEVIVADPNFAPVYGQRSRRIKTDGGRSRCAPSRLEQPNVDLGSSGLVGGVGDQAAVRRDARVDERRP